MAIGLVSCGYNRAKVLNNAHTPLKDSNANKTDVGKNVLKVKMLRKAVIAYTV